MERGEHDWSEIYEYYSSHGLVLYVLNNISDIFIGIFISIIPVLLFGCFDINNVSTATGTSEIFHSFADGWKRINFFWKSCTIIFLLYISGRIAQFFILLPRFIRYHKYFIDKLGISDTEILTTSWTEVVDSIKVFDSSQNVTQLEIAQEILRTDNYLIALITDNSILTWKLPLMEETRVFPMSRLFFYYLMLTFHGSILGKEGSLVSGVHATRAAAAKGQLEFRFRLVGIILLIFSPFIFAFEVLFFLFEHMHDIKETQGKLFLRSWTPYSKWVIREYNELPHLFKMRLAQSYKPANEYLDQFPSVVIQPIIRTLSFTSGIFIGLFLIVGLRSDITTLMSLHIFGNKTVAWLVTVVSSIYVICSILKRPENTSFDPESALNEVEKYIHYEFREDNNQANSWKTHNNFTNYFQPLCEQMLIELISVILNPFLFIFVLPFKASSIVEFIKRTTISSPQLGMICSFSMFDSEQAVGGTPEQRLKVLRSQKNFTGKEVSFSHPADSLVDYDSLYQGSAAEIQRAPSPLVRTSATPYIGSNEALDSIDNYAPNDFLTLSENEDIYEL